jgi:uncharacterized membrane protein
MPGELETNGNGSGAATAVLDALKSKEMLVPAALSAAAAVAAAKAPDLVRSLTSKTEEKGEEEARKLGQQGIEGAKQGLMNGGSGGGFLKGAMSSVASKVGGGGGGGGGKKTRRLPIQRWTDVAVPVDQAYEAWTNFEEFPNFMHRVLEVKADEDDKLTWKEKIWFSTREWEGEITERRKNDRIAWKTVSGTSHEGVVSFHPLGDNLTRVMVDVEFEPTGMMEKMASGLRFVKRAVQSDLARFKAYVEFEDAEGLEYPKSGQGQKSQEERDEGRRQRQESRRRRRESAGGNRQSEGDSD